ncbi:MAG: hypothetical protein ACREDJ_00890 [Methylocella sp.]
MVPNTLWRGADLPPGRRGMKAEHLDRFAACAGRAHLRFDYSGHGLSEGRFGVGTIGTRLEQRIAAIRDFSVAPQILVGSSMGG